MEVRLTGNIIIRHKSIPDCQWCDKAKELFEENKEKYTVIYSDKRFFGELMKVTKSTMVPQIIVSGKYIGDYNDLLEYYNNENNVSN